MKSSTTRILSIAVAVLLIVNVILLFFIWKNNNKPEPKRPPGTGPFETMAKELNMTEQQKNDYKKMRDEYFARVRPLMDTIRQFRSAFFKMIADSTVNDDSLSAYSKRIAGKQASVDKMTFGHFKKVRTLFSGDQQKQFDEYMQKMMQRRRDSTNNNRR